jgi:hypothetical protein
MRIGLIGYLAKTGIGIMLDSMVRHLGVEAQLVIPHDTAERLDSGVRHLVMAEDWTPSLKELKAFSDLVDVAITVEADWGGSTFHILRSFGVKVVQIPMWEWYQPDSTQNRFVDLWICTTRQCYQGLPWPNKVYLPWPVDTKVLKFKHRRGHAKTFIHNAGNVGIGGRKGTVEAIEAFKMTRERNPDIRLLVNIQGDIPDEIYSILVKKTRHGEEFMDDRIEVNAENVENYADLYAVGDVLIYCSHYDGQALVSEEAMACGMPVITNTEPPMCEHWMYPGFKNLNRKLLVRSLEKKPAGTTNPATDSLVIDTDRMASLIDYCARTNMGPISIENRDIVQKAMSWKVCKPYYMKYLEMIYER